MIAIPGGKVVCAVQFVHCDGLRVDEVRPCRLPLSHVPVLQSFERLWCKEDAEHPQTGGTRAYTHVTHIVQYTN